ncbi:Dabb family protein [Serratia rubidaea]|uniref:Stress responsive A/B Barrel Domain n=1 Tax=Serratia rubidaea TaxID=61652 RepID=A0A448S3X2_SERRU|nr:Dabb family protein [Serratia rubidaea]VEI62408.1 Stress responsive A/B Barrel Domain [Serratia rubidaea]
MHIVLFKFKKPYSWASMEAILAERSTREHVHNIDEIKGWTCGRNTTRRDIASDFVVIGLFDNRQALDAYIIHPDHQVGVEKWKSISEWRVVDIELNSDFTLNSGLLSVFNSFPAVF